MVSTLKIYLILRSEHGRSEITRGGTLVLPIRLLLH